MSGSSDSDHRKIGQAVDGFGMLVPRQVTMHEWRVLSWRNDSITAHKVDSRDLSCTCRDAQYRQEEPDVCDHVAVVLYEAKRQLDLEEALREQMYDQMKDLDRAVSAIQQKATAVRASDQAGDYDDDDQADSDDESGWNGDPVEQTKSLLRDAGWSPDDFSIYVDDDLGSVQIETDSLSQADFSDYQDWCMDQDWLGYDSDEYRNYIKEEVFPEVFG